MSGENVALLAEALPSVPVRAASVPSLVPLEAARRHPLLLKAAILAVDLVGMALAMKLAFGLGPVQSALEGPQAPQDHLRLAAVSLPLWVVLFFRYRLYSANHVATRWDEVVRLVQAVAAAVVGMASLAFLVDLRVARAWLPLTFITATLVLGGQREAVRQVLAGLRRRGRLLRRVVIVGGNRDAMALCANLKMQRALGYEVVGFVADTDSDELLEGVPRLGSMERAREAIVASHAQGVILVSSALDTEISNQVIRQLSDASVRVDLLPSLVGVAAGRLSVRTLGRFPLVHVRPVRRRGWRQAAKRTFDLALALGGLVVTAPVLGLIALAVKLDSPGPVLFRQKRVGRKGQLFDMLKFRSMAVDAEERVAHLRELNEADGPLFKMRGDPRVTRTGRFLRRFSLDELPQLWNVVKGDMAIVGPRPALPEEITGWSPQLHERLKVKPGITGLWQVNGRSAASFADYTNLDLYYVDNWSLLADLTIVARTIPAVLCRKGAY